MTIERQFGISLETIFPAGVIPGAVDIISAIKGRYPSGWPSYTVDPRVTAYEEEKKQKQTQNLLLIGGVVLVGILLLKGK